MSGDLTVELAQRLADRAAEAPPFVEISVRPDYSGRGMFGATTVAFTARASVGDVVAALCSAAVALGVDPGIVPTRSDSMGLGVVVY